MLTVRAHASIASIPAHAWDLLVGEGSPFLEHAWIELLEESGSATPEEGWIPRHLTVWEGETLVAACPAWIKLHSYGEFVYDWSFASFAQRHRIPYYPKLVVAVPFTPVTGSRLLTHPDRERGPLLQALVQALARLAADGNCGGLHVLFDGAEEAAELEALGAATRLQYQFHWVDKGFGDFEGWLASLGGRRRKEIRRERRLLAESGVKVEVLEGDQIRDLRGMYGFYLDTCARHGGEAYLKPALWERLLDRWRHRLLLVQGVREGQVVGGSLLVHKGDRLYGRYWGSAEEVPFLHFEACYYAPVELCLQRGWRVFEPGHGGEHKYLRGFGPELCHSSHWFADPRLDRALREHLKGERDAVLGQVEALRGRTG